MWQVPNVCYVCAKEKTREVSVVSGRPSGRKGPMAASEERAMTESR